MKRTVAETFGRAHKVVPDELPFVDWPDPKQLIGIEIEFEMGRVPGAAGTVPPNYLTNWTRESDGSLISGQEYKLSRPLAGGQLAEAIHEFFRNGVTLHRSITSGTHIHINMDEDYTPLAAVQAIGTLVYVIEPAIFALIDPGRKWSGFTNPLDSAPRQLLSSLFHPQLEDTPHTLTRLCESNHAYKYYGLNVQTLGSYGTLEFRYFPTATSADELIGWVSMVQSIKLAGLAFPSLEAMSAALSTEDGYSHLIGTYLSRWAEDILRVVPYRAASARLKDLKLSSEYTESAQDVSYAFGTSNNAKYKKFFKNATAATPAADVTDRMSGRVFETMPAQPQYGDILLANSHSYIWLPTSGWSPLTTANSNGGQTLYGSRRSHLASLQLVWASIHYALLSIEANGASARRRATARAVRLTLAEAIRQQA